MVYRGVLHGRAVAVKRILLEYIQVAERGRRGGNQMWREQERERASERESESARERERERERERQRDRETRDRDRDRDRERQRETETEREREREIERERERDRCHTHPPWVYPSGAKGDGHADQKNDCDGGVSSDTYMRVTEVSLSLTYDIPSRWRRRRWTC